ncbi:MAG: peptide chain release factor N(5)-glutamine methyltransferase [Kangiellaceae bacterium]|nr:peptide chain release factor N(5)-glutamine methyltransferase [Kangiellaceae bacterium]
MNLQNPLSVQQAIHYITETLASEEASDDARYLMSFIMKKNFTWLRTWPEQLLVEKQITLLYELTARRKKGEPVAYIIGEQDFWTLTLRTNASTLIPRAETELLVERALNCLVDISNDCAKKRILDLGTGTGAIALAIASERPKDQVIAVDFSPEAVELAQSNAVLNKIKNVDVFQSDWFNSERFLSVQNKPFDLIVSNPPYIEENDPHLKQGDLVFEPSTALVAKDKGLADIKLIIGASKNYLKKSGQLMIEHGFQQADSVQAIFIHFGYSEVVTETDLAGHGRITRGTY